MDINQFLYLPLAPALFVILVVVGFLVLVLGLIRRAYRQLGLSPAQAMLLLIGSLIGSCINIPLTVISTDSVMADQMVEFFGMRYPIPPPTDWGGTVLAINVGGAIIPVVMSVFLLIRWRLWFAGLLATAVVSAICYWFSSAVPGMGIAVPVFIPAIAATVLALLLSRQSAAPLAYIAGSLGTLIGGDLLNYGQLAELGAPILSIGGAGTFDAVFLTGVIAVLITGISPRREDTKPTAS
ncbi:DUF1614 domain-containing protein [Mesorhizobium sp. KR2-14]|uniref:DUF1614 domain-containing protein n=1 Tax=Mesorhizobium sp. KR2-14 TaxID=3156610 RepID=UPI0032B3C06B